MKLLIYFCCLLCICSCTSRSSKSDVLVSMQLIDRNGFSETISSTERLSNFASVDFSLPQPYKKVLRVYGRDLQGRSSSIISSYHDNGQLWQSLNVVDGRAQGFYREWHANGKLKIEAQVIEGMADISELAQASWLFNGKSSVWDEKGTLIAEIFYDKGVLEGPSTYYHSNGRLEKTIPYHYHEIDGSLLVYNEEGMLIERTDFVKGKKEGHSERFFDQSKETEVPALLCFEEEYRQGVLMRGSYYDPQGKLLSEVVGSVGFATHFRENRLYSVVEYREGMPEGIVEIFFPDGNLYMSYHIKEGKKTGEECEYYPIKMTSGTLQPKLSLFWHEDLLQGIVKTWYDNGHLESQREIDKNKKHGLSFAWYRDGSLMLMEEYAYDQLLKGSYFQKGDKNPVSTILAGDGIATLFTSEGFFSKKISYEKGKPLVRE